MDHQAAMVPVSLWCLNFPNFKIVNHYESLHMIENLNSDNVEGVHVFTSNW